VDPRSIQGGQIYRVVLDDEGTPELFEYRPSAVLRFIAERGPDGAWSARKVEQPVEIKTIDVGGVVESALYESVQKTGESAPVGTPVWASAGGRVVEVGLKRGSGNTIVLAHTNGLTTRYYHLSRYARGLHVGQAVRQKDVIGYVGTTGLSTGPHLHFSVTKN